MPYLKGGRRKDDLLPPLAGLEGKTKGEGEKTHPIFFLFGEGRKEKEAFFMPGKGVKSEREKGERGENIFLGRKGRGKRRCANSLLPRLREETAC